MPKQPTNIIEPIDADLDDVLDVVLHNNTSKQAIKKFAEITKNTQQQTNKNSELEFIQEGEQRLFEFRKKKRIRAAFHNSEWMFSIVDVVEAMTDSNNPRRQWSDIKRKLNEEGFDELYEKIVQLKLSSTDGKNYETDTANAETIFRLIQSIPSKKAEPFKRWLAKVGYERIQESQDPELTIKRAMLAYKAKGYDDKWVNARLQTIYC